MSATTETHQSKGFVEELWHHLLYIYIDGAGLVLELCVKRTWIRFIFQNAVWDPLDVIAEVQTGFSFLMLTIKPSSCLTPPHPQSIRILGI